MAFDASMQRRHRVFILGKATRDFYDSAMSQVASIRLTAALEELKAAATARHRLSRTSPEYGAALEREIRIATEIRRLAASDQIDDRDSPTGRS